MKIILSDPFLKEASDFEKFDVKSKIEDPYYPNVYLMLLKFKKCKEFGLCIWDGNNNKFIEEPATLEDYDTDLEKLKKKHPSLFN